MTGQEQAKRRALDAAVKAGRVYVRRSAKYLPPWPARSTRLSRLWRLHAALPQLLDCREMHQAFRYAREAARD